MLFKDRKIQLAKKRIAQIDESLDGQISDYVAQLLKESRAELLVKMERWGK